MIIKKTYISDDGEEFETEEECLEYEKSLNSIDGVVLFDSKLEVIHGENPVDAYNEAFYIYISNVERAERFFDWIREYDHSPVPKDIKHGRIYFYYEPTGEYRNLDTFINEWGDIRNKILVKAVTTKLPE